MINLCASEACTGCASCANACPKQCIDMLPDTEGFLRPTVNPAECIECGRCQNACPLLHPQTCHTNSVAYAAIHKDDDIRLDSTSGGVFTLLCKWVLARGGVVFGAAYADDFSVEHRCVRSMEGISALRKAKYAQSSIGNSYDEVKRLLKEGQYVLFSGTPCQIAGLRAFLGNKPPKLILVDLICHGVPSPAVWRSYIHYRSRIDAGGASPVSINLRSKETGWPGYSIRFDYGNGSSYTALNSKDPFLRCFVGNLCLRPSCYHCEFKGVSRLSDFTLGDYWGVWNQLPEYNDGMGTSIVLLHTELAQTLWMQLQEQIRLQRVPLPECLDGNASALCSSALPAERGVFMNNYLDEDFVSLVQKLLPPLGMEAPNLIQRCLGKLWRLLIG